MDNQTPSVAQKLSPKFFFLSLGALVTLISSVSYVLVLFFDILEQKFPDALNAVYQYGYNSYNFDGIRGAIATLIILFPVFLVISYFWNKSSEGEMGKIDITIKKWMIYLILFMASVVVVVDLITLVRYFVSGEITFRFILKVLGTLIVAAIAGSYYIYELRKDVSVNSNIPKIYAAVSTILVIGLIVFSFMVIGSPAKQRMLRFDERRSQDLQSIQWQVINFWQQKEKLPEKIADLSNPISGFSAPVDPEMEKGNVYEYKKIDTLTFELCATFSLPMPKGWQDTGGNVVYPMSVSERPSSAPYMGGKNESWDHDAGRTCFSRTIDKDIYPPFPKPVKN